MVGLETTSEGIIWAMVKDVKVFDEKTGKDLAKILKFKVIEHDMITINLDGVEKFTDEGYREFSNLIHLAFENNCTLYFSEVHENLTEIIDSFVKNNES